VTQNLVSSKPHHPADVSDNTFSILIGANGGLPHIRAGRPCVLVPLLFVCSLGPAANWQPSHATLRIMKDAAAGFGTARALNTDCWMIWHHIGWYGCEHVQTLRLRQEDDSEVATFACIQLTHKGVLVPNVHSPNTYTHCVRSYSLVLY
jgi:hypothetical protein